MSGPFQPDRIPEPRWLTYGPDDPHEPPENFMEDEGRTALRHLAEDWLVPVDIDGLMEKALSHAPDTPEAAEMEKAYKVWQEANTALRRAVEGLYDETVGTDWRD